MKMINNNYRIRVMFIASTIFCLAVFSGIAVGVRSANSEEAIYLDGNVKLVSANALTSSQGIGLEPQIMPPFNTSYVIGTTGNSINWTIFGVFPGDAEYTILKDSEIKTDSVSWNQDSSIIYNIDGLDVGTYNFTIIIEDNLGNTISNTVLISVINGNGGIFILIGCASAFILIGIIMIKKR